MELSKNLMIFTIKKPKIAIFSLVFLLAIIQIIFLPKADLSHGKTGIEESFESEVFGDIIQEQQINNSLRASIVDISFGPESEKNITEQDDFILVLPAIQGSSLIGLVGPETIERGGVVRYTVQKGNTISTIAQIFGVSENTVRWANNLSGDLIKPGQELVILPVSGLIHKVTKGETINSIIKKYKANKEQILAFNDIPSDARLQINQELIIPNGKKPAPKVYISRTSSKWSGLKGYFGIPAKGVLTQRAHGANKNAVDIGNKCGTAVYAAAAGAIAKADSAGWNGGAGKYLTIKHSNGTSTLYAHLKKILVKAGQKVNKGQKIGLMGSTGRSTGCHLHYDIFGAKNSLTKYKTRTLIK
ncbi:hypothetical protein CL633_00330 [bacterium]|nr:hypothetical protein [bacterium]